MKIARKPRRSRSLVGKADPTIGSSEVYDRVRAILDAARMQAVQSVNSIQVVAYWLVGQEVVEAEQQGKTHAGYGEALIDELSHRLRGEFGRGFTPTNLRYMRLFYRK